MKNGWLEIAEYITIAGSIAGSAVAVLSQQLVYAAAPVSASLLLNLLNRRRLEELAPPSPNGEVTQIHRQLSDEVESLRASVRRLPTQEELRGVKEALQAEMRRLEGLETAENNAAGDISHIHTQYSSLLEAVATVSNRLEEFPPASRVETLERAFARTTEELAQLETELTQLQTHLQNRQTQSPADAQAPTTQAYALLEQQVEQLRATLAQVQQDAQNRVPAQDFNSLVAAMNVLEQAVAPATGAISDIQAQLDALSEQVYRQSNETLQTTTLQQLEEVRGALAGLERRIDLEKQNFAANAALGTGTTELVGSEELTLLSNTVDDIRLELDDLRSQIRQRSGVTVPATMSQQLDELRESLNQLTQRIETDSFAAQPADAQSVEIIPLSQAIDDIRLELDDLRSQIRQRSGIPVAAANSQSFDELRESLNQLNRRIVDVENGSIAAAQPAEIPSTGLARIEELTQLGYTVEDLRLELDDLRSQIRQRSGVTVPAGISQQLDELRASLNQLTGQGETGSIAAQPAGGLTELANIEELTQLSQTVEDMRLELDDLRSQIRQRSGVTVPAGISQQLDELRDSLTELSWRVETSSVAGQPATAQPADLAGIEQVLAKIAQSVAESKAQIESRLTQLEAREINPLGQDVAQLQHEYASLLDSVAGLIARLDSLPPASRIENLETTLAQLVARIETLPTDSVRQSAPAASALEGQLEEFRTALTELERQLQNPTAQTSTPAAIEQAIVEIQAELENLRRQVNQPIAAVVPVDTRLQIEEVRGAVDALNRRIDDLPLPEPVDFTGVEDVLNKIAESVAEAKARLENRLAQLEAEIHNLADLEPVPGNLLELREQYAGLLESVAGVTTRLESSPSATKIDELERAITEAWERIAYLQTAFAQQQSAPASVEVEQQLGELRSALGQLESSLEHLATKAEVNQHLGDIQKLVSDLREHTAGANTDWQQLRQDVQALQQQVETLPAELQTRITAELQEPLNALTEQFNQRPERQQIEELRDSLTQLYRRINVETQNYPSESAELAEVEGVLAKIAEAVAEAKAQMESRIAEIQSVDVDSLQGDISGLHAALDRLETGHIAAIEEAIARLQTDLETVSSRSTTDFPSVEMPALSPVTSGFNPDVESGLADATTELAKIQQLVTQAVEHQLGEINQLLKALQTWEFKLVFDCPGVRAVLEEALETAQERLIVVCPWVSRASLDSDLLRKFEAFLARNGRLDIGWGNLKDIDSGEFPRKSGRYWESNDESDALYDALNDLEALRSQYPNQLRLKVLGTHENYLVSDSTSAMLTTHNFLRAGAGFPEREVGVITTDPRIIQGLIDRFDDPVLNPNNAYAYRKRGFERLDSGDSPSAIEDYTQALEIDPNNANVYNNRGVARSNLGEHAAAIEDYSQALLINPNEGAYYFNRGFSRSHMAEYAGAIADFTEAIRLLPDDADAYFQRGEAYRLLGQYQNAVDDYTQALQLNPEDAIAHNNRGLAYYELGNRLAAIADYNQALQINSDDAIAYFNRGVALAAGGDYVSAIADFNNTLTHNPDHAGAYHHRGLAHAEIGDRQKAIEDLQTAANLFSNKGDTDSAQQILETVKNLQS